MVCTIAKDFNQQLKSSACNKWCSFSDTNPFESVKLLLYVVSTFQRVLCACRNTVSSLLLSDLEHLSVCQQINEILVKQMSHVLLVVSVAMMLLRCICSVATILLSCIVMLCCDIT